MVIDHRINGWTRKGVGLVGAGLVAAVVPAWSGPTVIPLTCTTGPSGQHYDVSVSVPASAPAGSTYWVRANGVSSGRISQTGLNHIHDMTYEYRLPESATYVDGSAQIVPDTGSANVRAGARISQKGGVLTMVLPGHVEDGTDYTPPSFKLQLKATGVPGSSAGLRFVQYRVTANAVVIGDLNSTCDPTPKPFIVGTTAITAA